MRLAYINNRNELKVFNVRQKSLVATLALDESQFPFLQDNMATGILSRKQKITLSNNSRFVALNISSFTCDYPRPNSVALIDLETSTPTLTVRPTNEMTGDLIFSPDSRELFVFNICGGNGVMNRWLTSQPSLYHPVGSLTTGVNRVSPLVGSNNLYIIGLNDELSRSIEPVQSLAVVDYTGRVVYELKEKAKQSYSLSRNANSFAYLGRDSVNVFMNAAQITIKTQTLLYSSVYLSSNRRDVVCYNYSDKRLDLFDLDTRQLIQQVDLKSVLLGSDNRLTHVEVNRSSRTLSLIVSRKGMLRKESLSY